MQSELGGLFDHDGLVFLELFLLKLFLRQVLMYPWLAWNLLYSQ